MQMMHGSGNMLTMLFMGTLWIGLIVFGIYLTIYFIRGGDTNKEKEKEVDHKQRQDQSLTILNERLAKGEIDEAEYARLKSIIQNER